MLSLIFDILHILYILLPIGIFLIPGKYFWLTKIIILVLLLTPLHWSIFDGNCILSWLSVKNGGLKNSKYGSPFSEKYLGWLFLPILDLLGMERNKKNFLKLVNVQWIANYLILFYYIFYHIKCTAKK